MVSARKFVELGAPVTEEIAPLEPIETTTRNLTLEFDDPEALELPENTEAAENSTPPTKAFSSKASD